MPVTATALGAGLEPREILVTTRMVLAYAAGIGDAAPLASDAAGDEPVVASPAFCAALEWPVLSAPRRAAILGITPDEARRAVHVEQDSTLHRAVRAGDRLVTTGRIAGVRQARSGALVHTDLSTVDAGTGAAVVTTRHGAIYRGVEVRDAAVAPADRRTSPLPVADQAAGAVAIAVAFEMAHVYSECAGIWNPIHTERRAARAAGLPGIILHGTAAWAIAGRELVRRCADGDPTRLRRLRGWFAAPIRPGTTITLIHEAPTAAGTVTFIINNADGQGAVTDGLAEIAAARVTPGN